MSPLATTEEDKASPLLDLVEKCADLLAKEMLERVDPAYRAFFAQVSHGCRAAVLAPGLPCAGTRVGLRQLNPEDRARLAGAVRTLSPVMGYSHATPLGHSGHSGTWRPPTCLARSCAARNEGALHVYWVAGLIKPRRAGAGGTGGRLARPLAAQVGHKDALK